MSSGLTGRSQHFTNFEHRNMGVIADIPAHTADDALLVIQTGNKFHFKARVASTSAEAWSMRRSPVGTPTSITS